MHIVLAIPLTLVGAVVGLIAYLILSRVVTYQTQKYVVKDLKKYVDQPDNLIGQD